jgi:tRNA dimethylallyltransferase
VDDPDRLTPVGYKEFHGYLSAPSQTEKTFNEAIENMKLSTRQYAKRQISWIRNKLLPAVRAVNVQEIIVPTYLLDATGKLSTRAPFLTISPDISENWISSVRDPAVQLSRGWWSHRRLFNADYGIRDFLNYVDLPDPLTLSEIARTMLEGNDKPVE